MCPCAVHLHALTLTLSRALYGIYIPPLLFQTFNMCITNLHYYSTGNQCSALEAVMPRGSVSSVSELGSALKGFYVGAVPAKTGTLKVRSSDGSALFFSSYSYTFWPILLQSTSSFSRTLLHTNTSARNGRGVATPILSHLVYFRAQFLFLFPSSPFLSF